MKLKGMACGVCAALLWLPVSGQAAVAPATRPSGVVPATQGNLMVRITGIQNDNGVIRIAIFNNQTAYENKNDSTGMGAYKRAALPIKNNVAVWQLNGLPYGDYAIKLYHDEDNSGKLKRSLVGKPKEGVGFSNNPKLDGHAPKYSEVKFSVDKPQSTTTIQMINP